MNESLPVLQTNSELFAYVNSLERRLKDEAKKKLGDLKSYSGPEAMAMVTFEALSMTGELDLAITMVRGKILSEASVKNLHAHHPGGYHTLKEAAKAHGISESEASNYRMWWETLFPELYGMGYQIQEVWEDVGKSNLRDATPILMSICTGEKSPSDKVNEAVEKIYQDIKLTEQATGTPVSDEERKQLATSMVIFAASGTNRDLRQAFSPTPPIHIALLSKNGSQYIIAKVTEDQISKINRLMHDHITVTRINLDVERADTIPVLKEVIK